jgi:hypothetical protein
MRKLPLSLHKAKCGTQTIVLDCPLPLTTYEFRGNVRTGYDYLIGLQVFSISSTLVVNSHFLRFEIDGTELLGQYFPDAMGHPINWENGYIPVDILDRGKAAGKDYYISVQTIQPIQLYAVLLLANARPEEIYNSDLGYVYPYKSFEETKGLIGRQVVPMNLSAPNTTYEYFGFLRSDFQKTVGVSFNKNTVTVQQVGAVIESLRIRDEELIGANFPDTFLDKMLWINGYAPVAAAAQAHPYYVRVRTLNNPLNECALTFYLSNKND